MDEFTGLAQPAVGFPACWKSDWPLAIGVSAARSAQAVVIRPRVVCFRLSASDSGSHCCECLSCALLALRPDDPKHVCLITTGIGKRVLIEAGTPRPLAAPRLADCKRIGSTSPVGLCRKLSGGTNPHANTVLGRGSSSAGSWPPPSELAAKVGPPGFRST